MKRDRITYLNNILFPCVVFSGVTGVVTGGLIFLFRWGVSFVADWSFSAYEWVRQNPLWLGVFLLIAGVLGGLSWLFWNYLPDGRGGGIPASIGWVRGVLSFRWFFCLIGTFFASMITYLGGVPLGTEGPSVLMGTAVGKGTVRLLGRRHPAWDRYVMTGGAGAGFAAATGAPLTGILFAFEEAHQRFSPMLLMVSAMTAISASLTSKGLFTLTGTSWSLFDFPQLQGLPLRYAWAPLLVGIVCGLFAVVFTKGYDWTERLLSKGKKVPSFLRIVLLFVLVALVGFFFPESTGSGHDLIESVFHGQGFWFLLVALLLIRAVFLIFANNLGITGGLFIPSLAFGALLGALCGKALITLGILPESYFGVLVLVGMCSFLGASARTPLMAIAFSMEALSGINNVLPVVLGVCFAFVVIELTGMECFVDTVLFKKIRASQAGKQMEIKEEKFTVQPNSFVIGKEVRDILWPPHCQVLSIDHVHSAAHGGATLEQGDVLHLYYQTSDPDETSWQIEALLGKQVRES